MAGWVWRTGTTITLAFVVASTASAYELEGFVVDVHDRLLPDVTVSIEGTNHAAQTDSLGAFRFTDVPRGRYGISVRRSCVITGHVDAVTLPRPIRVPLPIVAYDVTDSTSAAVSNADAAAALRAALGAAVRDESVELATTLLMDETLELVSQGLGSAFTLRPDAVIPVRPETDGTVPALLARFRSGADRQVIVTLGLSPNLPENFQVLRGDRAVVTVSRDETDAWHVVHEVYCLTGGPDVPASVKS